MLGFGVVLQPSLAWVRRVPKDHQVPTLCYRQGHQPLDLVLHQIRLAHPTCSSASISVELAARVVDIRLASYV